MGRHGRILWWTVTKKPKHKEIKTPKKKPYSANFRLDGKEARHVNFDKPLKSPINLPLQPRFPMQMEWTDEKADLDGQWSWGQSRDWSGEIWTTKILPFLKQCECKTWQELEMEKSGKNKKHKEYEISAICAEAQKRLVNIQMDDFDQIFRFGMGSKRRFYGFRIQHVFSALWWDEFHKICESDIQKRGKVKRGTKRR